MFLSKHLKVYNNFVKTFWCTLCTVLEDWGIGDVIPDDRTENFFRKHFYLSLIGTGSSTTKDDERGTVAGK